METELYIRIKGDYDPVKKRQEVIRALKVPAFECFINETTFVVKSRSLDENMDLEALARSLKSEGQSIHIERIRIDEKGLGTQQ